MNFINQKSNSLPKAKESITLSIIISITFIYNYIYNLLGFYPPSTREKSLTIREKIIDDKGKNIVPEGFKFNG